MEYGVSAVIYCERVFGSFGYIPVIFRIRFPFFLDTRFDGRT